MSWLDSMTRSIIAPLSSRPTRFLMTVPMSDESRRTWMTVDNIVRGYMDRQGVIVAIEDFPEHATRLDPWPDHPAQYLTLLANPDPLVRVEFWPTLFAIEFDFSLLDTDKTIEEVCEILNVPDVHAYPISRDLGLGTDYEGRDTTNIRIIVWHYTKLYMSYPLDRALAKQYSLNIVWHKAIAEKLKAYDPLPQEVLETQKIVNQIVANLAKEKENGGTRRITNANRVGSRAGAGG